MKTRIMLAVSLLLCLLLCACGGSSGSSSQYNVITSGNWSLPATSSVTNEQVGFGGNLTQTEGNVSGVLHVSNLKVPNTQTYCYDQIKDDVPVSGSWNGNELVLTSSVVELQTLTLTLTGTGTQMYGTYAIVGGCADGDYGNIQSTPATWLGPINQTSPYWGATLGDGSTLCADLTQSSTADAHGRFAVTGSFTYSGTSCADAGTVSSTATSWGDNFIIPVTTTGNSAGTANLTGTLSSSTGSIQGPYTYVTGNCSGVSYPAVLAPSTSTDYPSSCPASTNLKNKN